MFEETPAQLVAHLGHPNGWWRDTAQRLLILRQDKSVVPALQQIVKSSDNLLARFHALWTLEGLDALDAALVRQAMEDGNPRMRVQAIRASETLYKAGDMSLAADYRRLATDPDADVSIQAMLTVNTLKAGDIDTVVASAQAANKGKGVQDIGKWILNPSVFPGGRGGGARGGGPAFTTEQQHAIEQGGQTFDSLCFSCHGKDGHGQPEAGAAAGTTMAPPLAGSPRVQGHRDYVIKVLLYGLAGPVDGKTYSQVMIPMGTQTDEWVAATASFVRNSFGNTAGFVTAADVARVRAATPKRKPWTIPELEASLPSLITTDSGWKLSASHNASTATNALTLTGWTSGAPQAAGMWFQVELPVPVLLTEVQFNAGGGRGGGGGGRGAGGPGGAGAGGPGGPGAVGGPGGPGAPAVPAGAGAPGTVAAQPGVPGGPGAPGNGRGGGPGAAPAPLPTREFSLEISLDGTRWTPVARGANDNTLTTLSFKPVQAKFVRITQTSTEASTTNWSITNLRLFEARK
jgi:mono/diheme cytochrome c family protein